MIEGVLQDDVGNRDRSDWFGTLRDLTSVAGGVGFAVQCWHVWQTYLWRARFWVFGAVYLLIALWWVPRSSGGMLPVATMMSVLSACLLAGFFGLHLRRQLSGPMAHAVPGYVLPHLAVAAATGLILWVAVPILQATLLEVSPLQYVGWHAAAALLMALVLVWARAILLLVCWPLVFAWLAIRVAGKRVDRDVDCRRRGSRLVGHRAGHRRAASGGRHVPVVARPGRYVHR